MLVWYHVQGAVSGIATDSVASSEHDDGASEVTVLDVGAENDGLMNCVDEQEECSVDGNHRDLCNAKGDQCKVSRYGCLLAASCLLKIAWHALVWQARG